MSMDLSVYIKILGQLDPSVGNATKEAQEKFGSALGKIEDLSSRAVIGFGLAAAGFGLIGKQAVANAMQMEVYQAKLETVLKSSAVAAETLKSAIDFAASTPFDVAGIVDATVQLEVYGAKSKEVLPLVGNLAAGMGKSIEETALALGKAWSGSLEGFESMRNTFGITIAKLKEYGATVDKQGQLQVKTNADLDKAREALKKIIELNFGNAMERQMNTLTGSWSNFKDTITKLSTEVGQSLVPSIMSMTKSVTGAIDAVNKMDPVVKKALAWSGVITAGVIAVGGTLGALARTIPGAIKGWELLNGVSMLYIQNAMTGQKALVAYNATLAGTSPVLALLTTSLRTATAAALAFAATPIGVGVVALLAAGAIYTVITGALDKYIEKQKKLDEQLTQQSRSFQQAASSWHRFRDTVISLAGPMSALTNETRNAHQSIKNTVEDLSKLTSREIVLKYKAEGKTPESMKQELGKIKEDSAKLQSDLQAVDGLLQKIKDKGFNNSDTVDNTAEERKKIVEIFGKEFVTLEEVTKKAEELNIQFKNTISLRAGLNYVLDVFNGYNDVFDNISKKAEQLKDFFDYSDKIGTMEALALKLKTVKDLIAEMQAGLKKEGFDVSPIGLLKEMKTASDADKPALNKLAGLYAEQEQTTKKIESLRKKEKTDAITAKEEEFSKRKQLNDLTTADEIAHTEQLLAIAKGNAELEAKYTQELAVLKRKQRKEDREDRLRNFEEEITADRNYISTMLSLGKMTETEATASWNRIGQKVQGFKNQNPDLLKDPAAKKKIDQAENEAQLGSAHAAKSEREAYYNDLQQQTTDFLESTKIANENNTQAEINALQTALKWWEDATAQKRVIEDKGNAEILKIRRDLTSASKKLIQEEIDLKKNVINAFKTAQSSEIDDLVNRQKTGEDVQGKLAQAIRSRLEMELTSLEIETNEKVKAAQDVEGAKDLILKEAMLKRQAIYKQEADYTKSLIKDIQGTSSNTREDQLKAVKQKYDSSRTGGAASPIQSLEEMAEESHVTFYGDKDKKKPQTDILSQLVSTLTSQVQPIQILGTNIKDLAKSIDALASSIKLPEGIKVPDSIQQGDKKVNQATAATTNNNNQTNNVSVNMSVNGATVAGAGARAAAMQAAQLGMREVTSSGISNANWGIDTFPSPSYGFGVTNQGGWGFVPVKGGFQDSGKQSY
ncbi:MAG: hypothetical protein AB9903_34320 [Vulcanimicrobiota bacterium]